MIYIFNYLFFPSFNSKFALKVSRLVSNLIFVFEVAVNIIYKFNLILLCEVLACYIVILYLFYPSYISHTNSLFTQGCSVSNGIMLRLNYLLFLAILLLLMLVSSPLGRSLSVSQFNTVMLSCIGTFLSVKLFI